MEPIKQQKTGKIIHIRKSGEKMDSMKGVKAPERTSRILSETRKGGTGGAALYGMDWDETAVQQPKSQRI